jgi:sulfite reductase alpha subunit-like flavoprotein
MYSASNATAAQAQGKAELLFRPLRWVDGLGRDRHGLCSTWLAGLSEGTTLLASVRKSDFHLDASTRAATTPGGDTGKRVLPPAIMFAGGTGVAPFRGFVKDLAVRGDDQPRREALLFVGARNRGEIPYLADFETAANAGDLTGLHLVTDPSITAFPEAITAASAELWRLMDREGGTIFVCGGATGFGRAMVRAIKDVVRKEGGDGVDPDAYFDALLSADRYIEDVADN